MSDRWMRDWWSYDWDKEIDRLQRGDPLELTREEFENYLRWLSVYEPEFFMEFCEGYMVRWCMQQLGFKWASRYGGNKS